MFKTFKILCLVSVSGFAMAQNTTAPTTVHKLESNETININHNVQPTLVKSKQDFCAETKAGCTKECQDWIKAQRKDLGKNLKETYCKFPVELINEKIEGCTKVYCYGQISWLMK